MSRVRLDGTIPLDERLGGVNQTVLFADSDQRQMRIVAAVTDPTSIRSYLDGIGLSARPPSIAPARPSPQCEFEPLLAASAA